MDHAQRVEGVKRSFSATRRRRSGRWVPGGGPFENLYVNVALIAEGRLQRFEAFDPADADRAVARFEELCRDG